MLLLQIFLFLPQEVHNTVTCEDPKNSSSHATATVKVFSCDYCSATLRPDGWEDFPNVTTFVKCRQQTKIVCGGCFVRASLAVFAFAVLAVKAIYV